MAIEKLAIEKQSAAEKRSREAIGHIGQAMRSLRQLQEQKAAAEHRVDRTEARAIAEKQRADEAEGRADKAEAELEECNTRIAELEERLLKAEANAKGNAPMSYACLHARMPACLCV